MQQLAINKYTAKHKKCTM